MGAAGTGAELSASFTLHGSGVSAGIAIGYAHLVSSARMEVAHYEIEHSAVEAEVHRFDQAVRQVRGELIQLQAGISPGAPPEIGAFLNVHRLILDDAHLTQVPRDLIRARHCNAEWALIQQMEALVAQFDAIEDPYLRERGNDIMQVVERVLKALTGSAHVPEQPSHEENLIIVAHDLSPADMMLFKQHQFAGFITDLGGVTSHTAIVARSLDIPAIVGLHHARGLIRENELLIVDGRDGVLIVNPNQQVLAEYRRRQTAMEAGKQKLKQLRTRRATTLDGVDIELQANIELPQDMDDVRESGATGISITTTQRPECFLLMAPD